MPGVQGRVALVTGASRGIGLATAKLLLSKGARVMAVARTESDLISSGLPNYFAADLSTKEGCQRAVDETIRQFDDSSTIDILVVNHGIGSAHEIPLHCNYGEQEGNKDTDKSPDDVFDSYFEDSMRTNLYGPYYLTRLVMPLMVANRYGRCVYTSSTAATDEGAEPAAVGYNTSKAGLCGLMRSVCQDGGIYNITSNAVLPGWVRTEMAEKSALEDAKRQNCTKEQIWEERAKLYPPKRVLEPEEVAHTILFLASEESSGISGESIRVALGCPW